MTRTPPSRRVVAAEVRAAMARADITQADLVEALRARNVDLSRTGLSERLNAHRAFNTDQLAAIAEVLDVSVFDLLAPPEPRERIGAAS